MGATASTRALAELEAALTPAPDGSANEKLVVSGRELIAFPPAALERARHLRELSLTDARLGSLPASIGTLVLLE